MTSITVDVPDELYETIREAGLDWSGIASRAIVDTAKTLQRLDTIANHADLSEDEALELAREVNSDVSTRFRD